MSVYGGDITELSWSNPDVGSGFFFPVAGESNTLDIGGFTNDDDGALDGAGRLIVNKKRMPGMFEIVVASDMQTTQEYETAKALAQSFNDTVFTIGYSNGIVYKGNGVVVGQPVLATDKSTFSLKVNSGLGFTQQ